MLPKKAKANSSIEDYAAKGNERNTFEIIVSRLVCKHLIPINLLATSTDFKFLFDKAFGKSVKNRQQVNGIIEYVYRENINETKALLKNKEVSLDCDEYSTKSGMILLNVNAHYIAESNISKKKSLGVHRLDRGDANSISQKISEIITEYQLHVISITTDGAASMKKTCELLKIIQQQCFLHGINLFVTDFCYSKRLPLSENTASMTEDSSNDSMSEADDEPIATFSEISCPLNPSFKDTINKVRSLMKALKYRPKLRTAYKKYTDLDPEIDCKTRWSSLVSMLKKFIQIINFVRQAAIETKELSQLVKFSFDEENSIQTMISVLDPVQICVNELSATDCNLISADLSMSSCVSKLQDFSETISEKFMARVLERRSIFSDILVCFQNQGAGNLFYKRPNTAEIVGVYNRIFPDESSIFLNESSENCN